MPVKSQFHRSGMKISSASIFHFIGIRFPPLAGRVITTYISTRYKKVFFALPPAILIVFFCRSATSADLPE